MRVHKIVVLLLACFTKIFFVSAQNSSEEKPDFVTLLDAIYSKQIEAISYEGLYERLWLFYHQPIHLNQTSREELKLLCILTDRQIDNFFNYLSKNGALVSIYELQAIPAFDLATIYLLLPFVKVEEVAKRLLWKSTVKNNYWITRYERTLEPKKGYRSSRSDRPDRCYGGSPDKIITRLSVSYPKDFSLGFTARKDAGEAITWDPPTKRYGLDFWSLHFFLQHKKIVKALVIGDYQVGYGQGLIIASGFSINKSKETINVIRTNNLGIKPHKSISKSGFFRGGALTLAWKHFEVTTYYSNLKLDGKILEDPSSGHAYIRSIQRAGLHRTPYEIAAKGQVSEQVLGNTFVYNNKENTIQVGLTTLYNRYSVPLNPPPKYHPYSFRGRENVNLGLFYNYLWQNFNFFGEAGISQSGGKAFLAGFVASLSANIDAAILLRHYEKNFHSLYGNAFRENSITSNEKGIYWGVSMRPIKKLHLAAYYDKFKFPWLTGRVDARSKGYDLLLNVTYQIGKDLLLHGQYREKGEEKNVKTPKVSRNALALGIKRNYAARLDYAISASLGFSSKVKLSKAQLERKATQSYAFVQDAYYKARKINIVGRIALFETDGYKNRLYFYERDVLYSFNCYAYYDNGVRYYLFFRYKISSSLRLEFKYARTWYTDRKWIGSGLEAIEGNTKTDVRLQVTYSF